VIVALLGLLLSLGAPAAPARAKEPWLLDLEASAGIPLTTPQRDWFGVGGSLALGVQRPLSSWFGLAARLRTAGFLDGDKPSTPGVKDPGLGTLNVATLGVVIRIPDGSARRATGFWIEGNGGGGFTGKILRPTLDAAIGYGFAVGKRTALAPLVRYIQVFQPNDKLSPADARLGLVGLRLSLFDTKREPRPAEPAATGELRDRDADGIPDESDGCPDLAEDKDGFQDHDGCPEPDNDRDGIADADDRCPNIAEDKDGFEDEDGCLDEDNDHDGVLDTDDSCPSEPETVNGVRDDDGCPDQGLIVMQDDRIVLEERVLFDVMRARVKNGAKPVLEAIVTLWKQHPEWLKVGIEGHADARGDAAFNQSLSERRAANVRAALIKLGLDPDKITAEGFGATRLRTQGTTEEDHRANRRVEFVVIARHGDAAAPESGAAEPPQGEATP
jgi:outer membrane protein OmpA-like peptidoglycan-associated protein